MLAELRKLEEALARARCLVQPKQSHNPPRLSSIGSDFGVLSLLTFRVYSSLYWY